MNKEELVAEIAGVAEISKADARKAVDAFIQVVTDTLKTKGEVRLVGFGNFETSKRAQTQGRNPRTGEPITIKAAVVPKFKPGKNLKEALN